MCTFVNNLKVKYPSDYIACTDIQIIIGGNNFDMLIYVAGEKRQLSKRHGRKGTRPNRRRNYGNKIRGTNGRQTRNWVGARL